MKKQHTLFSILFFICAAISFAQPRGGGFDPNEMIAREKQNLYRELPALTADQKMLLDGIYEEFGTSFGELRDEARKTRNFQAMRPKMEALRTEKDGLIKDVLKEEEFAVYTKLIEGDRAQREARRKEGGQRKQIQSDSTRNN